MQTKTRSHERVFVLCREWDSNPHAIAGKDFKSPAYTVPPPRHARLLRKLADSARRGRHGRESNPRIRVLQTLGLPLAYRAALLLYSSFFN